ncbi:YmL10 [Ciborinia camelliae]|nr:YmL10 [Ciborinia camelliae]
MMEDDEEEEEEATPRSTSDDIPIPASASDYDLAELCLRFLHSDSSQLALPCSDIRPETSRSRASAAAIEAIEAIEAIGGTVTTRFYTKPAIKRLLTGESVSIIPPHPNSPDATIPSAVMETLPPDISQLDRVAYLFGLIC